MTAVPPPTRLRQPTDSLPPTRYDVDQQTLSKLFSDLPNFRSRQIWDGLYRRVIDPADMTDLSLDLRDRVGTILPSALEPAAESMSKNGDTVKWLWRLRDGRHIETVLMHYPDRATVCVSSQAGCAMACGFCATGQAGFDRHLSVGEIIEQVARAIQRSRPKRVSNIVFMGMGEPLANYGPTWEAVERINADFGISARHVTVSTVGIVPGIRRLAGEALPVNLAVSLHAANDRLRNELVPINRTYPLAALLDACRDYLSVKNRRISFEWAMIDGVNDRDQDALELAALAAPLRAHVNLIPLNPTSGYATKASTKPRVETFAELLRAEGINATVRRNRGVDIDAACGQLRIRTTQDRS